GQGEGAFSILNFPFSIRIIVTKDSLAPLLEGSLLFPLYASSGLRALLPPSTVRLTDYASRSSSGDRGLETRPRRMGERSSEHIRGSVFPPSRHRAERCALRRVPIP